MRNIGVYIVFYFIVQIAKERVIVKTQHENSLNDGSIFKFFVEVFLDWLNLKKRKLKGIEFFFGL